MAASRGPSLGGTPADSCLWLCRRSDKSKRLAANPDGSFRHRHTIQGRRNRCHRGERTAGAAIEWTGERSAENLHRFHRCSAGPADSASLGEPVCETRACRGTQREPAHDQSRYRFDQEGDVSDRFFDRATRPGHGLARRCPRSDRCHPTFRGTSDNTRDDTNSYTRRVGTSGH
jgi:hypothetical protein